MLINGFDWDNKNLNHIYNHGVQDYEVEEAILFDKPIYQKCGDDTFIVFGVAENGRYLFIVFQRKEKGLIRIITARDMIEREKHNYKKRVR